MSNSSSYCEKLDLKQLVTNNNGKVELTNEGLEKARFFSEGNNYLFEALASCWKHGINTNACCSGHEGKIPNEDKNLVPYLSMVLDNNSLPYVRNIIANLQGVKDVSINAHFTVKEDTWGKDEPDRYKTVVVSCCLPNRCEVFYKIHEAIESRSIDKIPLNYKDQDGDLAEDFYKKVVDFLKKDFSPEEEKTYRGIFFGNWSKELDELLSGNVKESKSNSIFFGKLINKMFHNKKENDSPYDKYLVAQNYYPHKSDFMIDCENKFSNTNTVNNTTNLKKDKERENVELDR